MALYGSSVRVDKEVREDKKLMEDCRKVLEDNMYLSMGKVLSENKGEYVVSVDYEYDDGNHSYGWYVVTEELREVKETK